MQQRCAHNNNLGNWVDCDTSSRAEVRRFERIRTSQVQFVLIFFQDCEESCNIELPEDGHTQN